jgi:predicted nicotinamide N-methyase
MTPVARREFIRANTEILSPPLVPEVVLHLAHEALPIWQKTEDELDAIGLPPPFWAFAWAGGQALARHILDNPKIVKGKRVLDLASGSGLVGIAAMKAGAAHVAASEIDQFAVEAVALNAELNAVHVTSVAEDLLDKDPPRDLDVILVGDLFYEKHLATHCLDWLNRAQIMGIGVLIGDPGRSYLPKEKLRRIADYAVPVTRELEDAEIKKTAVWRLA